VTNRPRGESPRPRLPTPLRSLTRIWMELLAGRGKRRSSLMYQLCVYHRPRPGFYSLETGFVLLPHSAVSGCVYHFFQILLAVSTDNEASGRPWYGYPVRSHLG